MIPRFGTIALLLTASLLLFTEPANGSGGFGTSIAAFSTGACDDTASREWVELVDTYGLLCGRPKRGSIELVTVYAPGCDEGHLILRELEAPDGRTLFLFSAPAPLLKKTLRATIYLKGCCKDLALLEYVGANWERRMPQQVRVAADDGYEASQDPLLAFSVEGLGLFSLLEQDSSLPSASSIMSHDTSASSLLGGGISRGLLPLAFSVVLLVGGWAVSRWIHRMEQYAGK